jgi:WD40 repeat protein
LQSTFHQKSTTQILLTPNRTVCEFDAGNREGCCVQGLEFLDQGQKLVVCTDVPSKGFVDRAISVWDFKSGGLLSNQPYVEFYSLTDLKLHPGGNHFVAQSNGNYAAIFKSRVPFKLNKKKRFQGHTVKGFPIHCNFSLDGSVFCSGSSNGNACLYDWNTAKKIVQWKAHE